MSLISCNEIASFFRSLPELVRTLVPPVGLLVLDLEDLDIAVVRARLAGDLLDAVVDGFEIVSPETGFLAGELDELLRQKCFSVGSEDPVVRRDNEPFSILAENDTERGGDGVIVGGPSLEEDDITCGEGSEGAEDCDPNNVGNDPDPINLAGWYFDLPESGERVDFSH